MKTYTPRNDNNGRFESWGNRVDEAGEYSAGDAAIGVLAMALGAALWEGGKWAWKKLTDDEDTQ